MDEGVPNMNQIEQSRVDYLAGGIETMLRMGYINHPDVQDAIIANTLIIDDKIKDVSFVFDSLSQRLLLYIELQNEKNFIRNWRRSMRKLFGRIKPDEDMSKNDIGTTAASKLHQVLPGFEVRVTFDREVYEKALNLSNEMVELREKFFKDVRDNEDD